MSFPFLLSVGCFAVAAAANYWLFVRSVACLAPIAALAVRLLEGATEKEAASQPDLEKYLAIQLGKPVLMQARRMRGWTNLAAVGLVPAALIGVGWLPFGRGWGAYLAFGSLVLALVGLYRGYQLRTRLWPQRVADLVTSLVAGWHGSCTNDSHHEETQQTQIEVGEAGQGH